MEIIMNREVLEKLKKDPKYLTFLRENSWYYKELNRDSKSLDKFIKDMKIKYKLRTIDKVDNIVDSVDLITKIMNASND